MTCKIANACAPQENPVRDVVLGQSILERLLISDSMSARCRGVRLRPNRLNATTNISSARIASILLQNQVE
jgi:hypothetical protein